MTALFAALDGLLAGHVELKAPGLGVDLARFRDAHSKAQWEKFKALPNLLYTDGGAWTLYRFGERVDAARASGNPAAGRRGRLRTR